MRRQFAVGVMVVVGLASHGCGDSSPSFSQNTTGPSTPSAPVPAFAIGLTISGKASLSTLGETSQLQR